MVYLHRSAYEQEEPCRYRKSSIIDNNNTNNNTTINTSSLFDGFVTLFNREIRLRDERMHQIVLIPVYNIRGIIFIYFATIYFHFATLPFFFA